MIWFAMDLWSEGNASVEQEEERKHRDQQRHKDCCCGDQGRQSASRSGSAPRSASASAGVVRIDPTEFGERDNFARAKAAGLDITLDVENLDGLTLFGVLIRFDRNQYSCSVLAEDAVVACHCAAESARLCLRRGDISPDDCHTIVPFGDAVELEEDWQRDVQSRGVLSLDTMMEKLTSGASS